MRQLLVNDLLVLANLLWLATKIDHILDLLVIVDKLDCCARKRLTDLLYYGWILLLLLFVVQERKCYYLVSRLF